MKFKHLLFYSLFTFVVVSCKKNQGDNFTTDVDAIQSSSGTSTGSISTTAGADAPPASGDNSNLLFGNPTNAVTDVVTYKDNYLLDQGYYVEAYSSTKLTPIWVSWHLDSSNIGSSGRSDTFYAYAALPFTQVQSNSYVAVTYGFDRGHNCPSADRTSSDAANNATFLMTNMIPQAPNNNQQTWAHLEDYLRTLVAAGNEVYIIMGNYGSGGTGKTGTFSKIGPLNVNVPSNVWKVAVVLPVGNGDISRVTSATRVISVNTPNINTIDGDWKKYITTMGDIETKGGVSLLSVLPKTLHDALAAKVDPGI